MRRVVVLLFVLLMPRTASCSEGIVEREIDVQRRMTAAVLGEQKARLAVEQLQLRQLKTLQDKGHASWKEVAQQHQQVAALNGRVNALIHLRDDLAKLSDEMKERRASESNGRRDFVPVYHESSDRLVAWIDTADTTPAILKSIDALRTRCAESIEQRPYASNVEFARERLEVAERHSVYARKFLESEAARQSAALQELHARSVLKVAEELRDERNLRLRQLTSNVAKTTRSGSNSSGLPDEMQLANPGARFATSNDQSDLGRLTRRAIMRESQLSDPDSLSIHVELTQRRVEELGRLERHDVFDPAELKDAQSLLQELTSHQHENAERAKQLREAATAFVGTTNSNDTQPRVVESGAFHGDSMMLHRLRLRFDRLCAEFRVAETRAAADFHEEYFQRLVAVAARHPDAAPELDWLRDQTRMKRALHSEAEMKLEWLDIENQRLALQAALIAGDRFSLVQGESGLNPHYVPTSSVRGSSEFGTTEKSARRTSYIEVRSLQISRLIPDAYTGWDWDRLSLPQTAANVVRLNGTLLSRRTAKFRSSQRDSRNVPFRGSRYRTTRSHGQNRSGTIRQPQSQNGTTRYRDWYDFGMRRPEFRRPGDPPWYLPGSPTNFR